MLLPIVALNSITSSFTIFNEEDEEAADADEAERTEEPTKRASESITIEIILIIFDSANIPIMPSPLRLGLLQGIIRTESRETYPLLSLQLPTRTPNSRLLHVPAATIPALNNILANATSSSTPRFESCMILVVIRSNLWSMRERASAMAVGGW